MHAIEEAKQLETGSSLTLEVGFVAAFEDGRREKVGQVALPEAGLAQPVILKCLLAAEPSLREASYIMGMVRLKQSDHDTYLDTIEFTSQDIQNIIKKLIRPGIILKTP